MSTYSSDAAEQVVRMTLEGTEVAVRLAGNGAKQLAILLYAVLKDQKKTKGKIRLTNMLRSGKELKVFAVKDQDVMRFCTEAKKYGVLYTVLKDRDANDGLTDIMVRADDASKINRIFERFKLTTVDMGDVRAEIQLAKEEREKDEEIKPPERTMTHEEKVDEFLNDVMEPQDEKKKTQMGNPTEGRIAMSRQSEPSLKKKSPTARDDSNDPEYRPSVRKQLEEIRQEQKKAEAKAKQQMNQHKAPKRKRRPKKEDRSL